MTSYQETQLSRGSTSTKSKNIDPFRYHDTTEGLELGYMSSGVAERRNSFRLIETTFLGQWQVCILIIQTTSSLVSASCDSALKQ